MHITMEREDIQAIQEYFKNRHNSVEIGALDFMSLMNMKFTRVFDEHEAKRCLSLIKQRIPTTAKQICKDQDPEGIQRLTLRGFKMSLHKLKLLNQFQIDNLTKYLDTLDDGFIAIDKFDVELRNAMVPNANASFGNTLNQSATSSNLGFKGTNISAKHKSKW